MALPRTFDFTASDGTGLEAYDAGWDILAGGGNWSVSGNQLRTNNAVGFAFALLTSESPNADQEVSWVAVDAQNGARDGDIGCGVRGSGTDQSNANGYFFMCRNNGTDLPLYKVVAGSVSSVGSSFTPPSAGTTVKLKVTGTSPALLEVFYGGVSQGTRTDASSPLTSGSALIAAYSGQGGNGTRIDDLVVANVSAPPPASGDTQRAARGLNRGIARGIYRRAADWIRTPSGLLVPA